VSTFTVPATTAVPATYRIIAVTDALAQQTELDEGNNAAVSPPLPMTPYRPEVTVSALTVPATAQAGRPLGITHTVRNVGPAPATAFTVRFYLSSDEALDAGDVLLGARPLGSLAAGAASSTISTFTVPAATAVPASYRVIAVADALAQQTELDETNNTTVSASLPMTPYRPDVTVSAVSLPATAQAGRPLAITHAVRNVGPAPATAFTVRFYLSSDETLDAGDVLLGARPLGSLAAGAASSTISTFTVPAATAVPASYRVIAVADALAQQTELDEGNNNAVSAPLAMTAYRPDLSLTTLSVPATVRAGRPLAITHAVRNAGPAPAGAFVVRFHLSGDDTLDADDVLLGSRPIGALGAGVTSPAIMTLTVPAAMASGDYRVLAVVDALAQQAELDETNNAAASGMLTVSP
jgi:subtilase family serine protease